MVKSSGHFAVGGSLLIQCEQSEISGSGLYIDVENLGDNCQSIIKNLVDNWSSMAPKLRRMNLFVRADHVELWRLWATSRFQNLDVNVNGTQHFSKSSTKNSADISMAVNAMTDLLLKRVSHVVVLSDDSDFIALYCAIRDESNVQMSDGKPPFSWVVTDRAGSISETVKQNFPSEQLHIVSTKPKSTPKAAKSAARKSGKPGWKEIAKAVVEEIPVGSFKSTDFRPIIKRRWPKHGMSTAGGPAFGTEFRNNVWPELEKMGVKISNPGKKPIKYEMTEEAKTNLE